MINTNRSQLFSLVTFQLVHQLKSICYQDFTDIFVRFDKNVLWVIIPKQMKLNDQTSLFSSNHDQITPCKMY